MKRLCLTIATLGCLSSVLIAQSLPDAPQPAESSSSDWNNVAGLPHDEEIVVKTNTGRTQHCLFSGAIDTTLYCGPYLSRDDGAEYTFPRNEVEQVRLNQQRRNQRIVFWSLTGAGFVWGLATPPGQPNGTPRILDAFVGGAAGALAGAIVSFPASLLIPGKLVYRGSANAAHLSSSQSSHRFIFRSAQ